jgi:hypothetical protein
MTNDTIQIKVKQRINKLASNDYDNIMPWQIVEAFNKAQVTWCRRNLMGTNMTKTGDEASKRRIDDLQVLLSDKPLAMVKKDLYFQSPTLPSDYFEWKRISSKSKKDCCDKRQMVIYLAEEANVDELLRDHNKKPSFEWAETFATVLGNKIKVYTNNDFELENTVLTYYRQPRRIQIPGTSDPYTGLVSTVNVECEFKDDIVELFIDECVKILAGDLEDVTANQIADNSVETNN